MSLCKTGHSYDCRTGRCECCGTSEDAQLLLGVTKQLAIAIDGLRRGCSCRPGGGTCPCCLALEEVQVGE